MTFEKIALQVPKILLPKAGTDMTKWTVIACDQYTSDPDYWDAVRTVAGDAPTTLDLIFPEVFLEDGNEEQRIASINGKMAQMVDQGVLEEQAPGFILIDRKTSHAPSRKGLMVALDLEEYDFNKGATTLIRATEGTIVDRLPPRIRVREKAPIELPHIMVLIDDPERTVIEPLFDLELETAYDFELMKDGGHIKGWHVQDEAQIGQVASALEKLAEPAAFNAKYGAEDEKPVLYAMGDGNHSFATAKAIWETLKDEAEDKDAIMNHPARFALVELVNIHDEGLEFEPIHRVLFNTKFAELSAELELHVNQRGGTLSQVDVGTPEELHALTPGLKKEDRHLLPFVTEKLCGVFVIDHPGFTLEAASLQDFINHFIDANPEVKVDYIHGTQPVTDLGRKEGNIGFYLPTISKHDLFKTIIFDGALPRKTFSMGEADEKRFYLEARKIQP